jgi:hypothetical protein
MTSHLRARVGNVGVFDDEFVYFNLVQYFTANIFSIKEHKIYNRKYNNTLSGSELEIFHGT